MTEQRLIKIYDDLIPDYLKDYFELVTLGYKGEEFIYPTVPFKCKYESSAKEEELTHPPLSFVHVLKSSTAMSEYLENFGMIAQAVCNTNQLILRDILIARIFITVPHDTNLTHYKPHVDLQGKHLVAIYYVNDADGSTVLYNDDGSVITEIEPKRGRVALFDGSIKHSGGIPKKGPRCIVNYDLYV